MSAIDQSDLRPVRLLEIPVDIWAQSQEHFQDLMREFALIVGSPNQTHALPTRLLQLMDEVMSSYGMFIGEQTNALAKAALDGVPSLDLDYAVPEHAAAAGVKLIAILREADEYCRSGEHLLTMATPAICREYQNWFIAQFVDQLSGSEPVAWPAWQQAHAD